MQHNVKKYLFDISESINSIEEFIGDNKDFNHSVRGWHPCQPIW